ncbi:hypothetical protein PGQ11_001420 [Apiospora arundinis]|uniref:Ankyrin repeat protein n=1 Tax=Apiospora arundinis TaxID=335852 RepID=A0ABR2JN11_9PEZI
MPKLIELLLAKGCLRPGNVYCHVWALKNLACSHHFIDKRDEILLANCAKKICSHLSATLKSEPYEKPALPVDLLYVCVGFGHRPLLDELANTFDFATTNFNETEMWQMFQIATDYRGVHMNDWWQGRQYRRDCLEVLFQVDTNSCLLRHEFTFEGLCRAFLGSDGGEALVMDYLDRGGRYSLTFSTGTTALSQACHTGCLSLAERLIDLGADPDKSLTVGEEDLDTEDILWSRPQDNAKRLAIWRLLLKRGANPFRWHEANENRGFPWQQFTDNSPDDQFLPHLLGDMCRLATDELSDDGDLFEILYVACTRGKYYLIEQMRTRAKGRVDAMIREKAALFLQTLLIRLAPIPDSIPPANGLETISKMDGAIDTIRLILELAPPGILKSSWRLRQGREDFTALKVIRKLLTPPQNPHNHLPVGEACRYEEEHQYKINWCLKQRIQLGSSSTGKAIITILNRRIQWPTEWKLPDAVRFDTEEERYTFDSIKLPWGCDCWDHLLP